MTAILTHDCPYCGTRSVAMNYQGNTHRSLDSGYCYVWFLLSCGSCKAGTTAIFSISSNRLQNSLNIATRGDYAGDFKQLDFSFVELLPDRSSGAAPIGAPERVSALFDQAASNLANKNWDASGAMSRKCLDVATKFLAREKIVPASDLEKALKVVLKIRIDLLYKAGLITADIAKLAMVIKDEGNDASHDEEPYTQEDATALIEFTRVFLTYVFTIPHMVESVKPTEDEVVQP